MARISRQSSEPPRWQDVDPSADDICRVCRGEGSADHPLFHPCICSGSIRYVHEDCLMQWLNHSNRMYCELCQHRFTFRPIYAPDTPSRLPPTVLFRGLRMRIVRAMKKLVHAIMVATMWLYLLPNFCARVKNLMFADEDYLVALLRFIYIGASPNPVTDLGEGVMIMALTMAVLFSCVFLRDELVHNEWNPPWLVLPDAHGNGNNPNNNGNALAQLNADPAAAAPVGNMNAGANNAPLGVNLAFNPPLIDEGAGGDAGDDPDVPLAGNADAGGGNGEGNVDLANAFGEDLALAHIIGLDGTYAFMEYAFWFAVVCGGFVAMCFLLPHACGRVVVHNLIPAGLALIVKVLNVAPMSMNISLSFSEIQTRSSDIVTATQFKTPIYLYFGYIAFAMFFSWLYDATGNANSLIHSYRFFRKLCSKNIRFAIGLFFLGMKTGVLFFTEAVMFPSFFGGLVDFSSMDVFNVTLRDRLRYFEVAPGTFIFIHWIIGVLFISYFVWFVLLTRETLRPGLLWFVRNYQESNPFKELVIWPVAKSLKNLTFVLMLFLMVITATIYIPVKILCRSLKGVFPYNLQLLDESPIGELTIQFAVLHYIGPSLFQQSTLRTFVKWGIVKWAELAGKLLGLRSFLLGDGTAVNTNVPVNQNPPNNEGNLGAAHDQLDLMLVNSSARPPQTYNKPSLFPIRLTFLFIFLALTAITISGTLMTVPVLIGRLVLGLWFGSRQVHDIYTLFTGLFTMAVMVKGGRLVGKTVRNSTRVRGFRLGYWAVVAGKGIVAVLMLAFWLPLLVGLTFEVTFLKPVALLFDQTSIFQPYRCFVFGALIVKIILTFLIVAAGENNRWRLAMEQVYTNGFRNMNLTLIWNAFVRPVSGPLMVYLALPFFVARTYNLTVGPNSDELADAFSAHLIEGLAHCVFLGGLITIIAVLASLGYFKELHDQIRDELFLVGKKLVNYEQKPSAAVQSTDRTRENEEPPPLVIPDEGEGDGL